MANLDGHANLGFEVDARLVRQIGEQLVPSEVMALGELVKNAYDADATEVSIDFVSEPVPTIIVKDDGTGMSLEDLRRGWMVIGTAGKEKEELSPLYKRARVGRKGIGRFAAQVLGRQLSLTSVSAETSQELCVRFDWERFQTGALLESIQHDVEIVDTASENHGTELVVEGPTSNWEPEKIKKVMRDLIAIQAPPASNKGNDPGFHVSMRIHGERLELIRDYDLLREERVAELHGEVDAKGNGRYRMVFVRPSHAEITEAFPAPLGCGPICSGIQASTSVVSGSVAPRIWVASTPASDFGEMDFVSSHTASPEMTGSVSRSTTPRE